MIDMSGLLPTLTISDAQKVRKVLDAATDRIAVLEKLVVDVLSAGRPDDVWFHRAYLCIDASAHADELKHITHYQPYEVYGKVSICDNCGCINPDILVDPETGRGRATLCCKNRDIGWGKMTKINPSDYKDYYTRTMKIRSAPGYPADIPTVMEGKRIPRLPKS